MTHHAYSQALAVAGYLLLSVGGAAAQARQPPVLSPQEAQEDFDVLRRALEEAHGGLYRFTTRAELDSRFDSYRAGLNRSITRRAFAGVLAEAVAELRDGHARLELDSLTSAQLANALVLPLRVQFERGRLVVLFNDSPRDTTIHPGMELVSINGRSVPDLVTTLGPKVPGDGFIETGRRVRLTRGLPQLYWLHVDQSEQYTIVARDSAGQQISTTIPGILERDRPIVQNPVNAELMRQLANLDGPPATVMLHLLDDSTVARLRIRLFDGADFPARLDSAFRKLREHSIDRLVLDLRGNGGGVDEYGALLVSYFVDGPFRYFDHIHVTTIAPSFATWPQRTFDAMRAGTVPDPAGGFRVTPDHHAGVGEQRAATDPFTGRLVVLIDGGTFSTAADAVAHLRSRQRATFVGEETAGTYEGNTSGLNALIVLPHSKIGLKIMMYGYWNAVAVPEQQGRGTIPDVEVIREVADLLRGVDRPLDEALAILR